MIENRTGAGGVIGTLEVVKSAPDGYTLLMMSNTQTANESLVPQRKYELMRDLAPIAPVNYSDLVIVVNPQVPAKTLQEFIALAKSQPGKLNYASSGQGTPYHMAGELFKSMAGIDVVHVPYRNSGDARSGVIGGQVQMMIDAVHDDGAQRHRRSGAGARHHRQDALARAARRADGHRSRRSRIRGDHLARIDGAGRNAEADHRQAECRRQRGGQAAGRRQALGRTGRASDVDDARRNSTNICAAIL